VWKESGAKLLFNEVDEAEYSAIDSFSGRDLHRARREHGRKYEVETISLVDLLDKYRAPKIIDYLSIDTEGSEFDILNSFDFGKYRFRIITCEHNFEPRRVQIAALLERYGYVRRHQVLSQYDDWYVNVQPE
jgi:FkbM family methyltransferase